MCAKGSGKCVGVRQRGDRDMALTGADKRIVIELEIEAETVP